MSVGRIESTQISLFSECIVCMILSRVMVLALVNVMELPSCIMVLACIIVLPFIMVLAALWCYLLTLFWF